MEQHDLFSLQACSVPVKSPLGAAASKRCWCRFRMIFQLAANPKLAEVRPMMLIQKGNMFSFRENKADEYNKTMSHDTSKASKFCQVSCQEFVFRRSWCPAASISQASPKTSFINISKAENRLLRSFEKHKWDSIQLVNWAWAFTAVQAVRLKLPQLWLVRLATCYTYLGIFVDFCCTQIWWMVERLWSVWPFCRHFTGTNDSTAF